jgi:hypothetical protein
MGAGEMKILFYIIAAIFLFFTAPIWVPIVGLLGLATVIGGGAAVVAANHTPASLPEPTTQPIPTYVDACPCTGPHWLGFGDASDPNNWSWTWQSDGVGHLLSKRPTGMSDQKARAWLSSINTEPANQRFVANIERDWGL